TGRGKTGFIVRLPSGVGGIRVDPGGSLPGILKAIRGDAVEIRLSIDRFEGERKQIAVLISDGGQQFNFPKGLLPRGSNPGDVLTLRIKRDVQATRKVADETKHVQAELRKTDPGENIHLCS